MKSSFAIAYSDKSGKDFGGIPWILDDLNSEEECLSKSEEMLQEGYINVIPFQFKQRRKKDEEFNWDYVKKNKINNE